MQGPVLALAGGVGGAKLALGLARVLPPDQLVIAVNTGDDECFHGLHVSPDLDTVMYTLAGLANPETGWGLAGDTFNALEMLRRYGADTWFNLGDRDLATHIQRTQLLQQGATLSEVTARLCRALGVAHCVVPMSDAPVRTVLSTDEGELPMQDYFVRRRSEPRVRSIHYRGAAQARPAPGLLAALDQARLVVICPSNPFLSVGPILALPGVRERLASFRGGRTGLRVAVSPIVVGAALRGPAAKIMAELGYEVSSAGVAAYYRGVCNAFLMDDQDATLAPAVAQMGIRPVTTPIIMESEADKVALAERILELGSA
jgi:LPPG:FO 2-phospho-L-lactate transferase